MKRKTVKRMLSVLLALCLALSMLPVGAMGAEDLDGHWAAPAIETCRSYGVMNGDGVGYRPDDPITRAEFAAMVNRAFGYGVIDVPPSDYTDVPIGAWYADDLDTATALGVIEGCGEGTAKPLDPVTREQAAVILHRILRLNAPTATSGFADFDLVSAWATDAVLAMEQSGYIVGYNNQFMPIGKVSRGEAAQLLANVFGTIADSDLDAAGQTYGNVTIRTAGVSLKNAVITGDLFITEGVGDGDVWLENVQITGRLLAAGGGENSIHVRDLTVGANVVVDKPGVAGEQPVRFRAIQSNYDTIIFEGTAREVIIAEDIIIIIDTDGDKTVFNLFAPKDESAQPTLVIAKTATVDKITADVPASISGEGTVTQIEANAGGVEISGDLNVKPEDITTSANVTVTTDGDGNVIGTADKKPETPRPPSPPAPPSKPAPVIVTVVLPDGAYGTPYAATLAATNDADAAITWTIDGGALPDGLSLDTDGTIGGTATAAGVFGFTVAAEDANGRVTADLSITIEQATLSFTADDKTVKSNTAEPTFTYTVVGWKLTDTDTLVTTVPTFHAPGADLTTPGEYDIVMATEAVVSGANYAISYESGTLTVTDKAPAVIAGVTAQDGIYDGSPHSGYSGAPSIAEKPAAQIDIRYTGRDGTVYDSDTAPTNAGAYTVSFTVNDPAYAGSISLNFEIAKADPVVTFPTSAALTYGAALSASALTGGVGDGIFAWTDGAVVPTVNSSGHSVTFTPSDTTNFNALTQTVAITVTPATLTVTADDKTISYGDAAPSYTAGISGYVNGETSAVVSGAPSLVCDYTQNDDVDTYPITAAAGSLTAENYTFVYLNGTLTVSLASPAAPNAPTLDSKTKTSVTLSPPDGANPLFALEYGKSDDGNAANATWQDGLTFDGLDSDTTYSFFARYKADAAKNNVSAASGALEVTTDNLGTLTAADFTVSGTTHTYDQTAKSATVDYAGGITTTEAGTISISYSTASPTNAGAYDVFVTTTGGTVYSAIAAPLNVGTLTIGKANPTVTFPTSATLTYGETLSQAVLIGESNTTAGAFAFDSPATAPTVAQSGNFSMTFTPTDTGNFNTKTQDVTITVAKKSLTAVVGTPDRTLIPFNSTDADYGTTASVSITVSGLVGSDAVTIDMAAVSGLTLSDNADIGAAASTMTLTYNGTAAVTASTAVLSVTDANYTLDGASIGFTVLDGQTTTRQIPVTQDNIAAFVIYANTNLGLHRHYKLIESITLTAPTPGGSNWTAIGSTDSNLFKGSFDGQGNAISNLTIVEPEYAGMFYGIDNSGVVQALTLVNAAIEGDMFAGGIAAINSGTVLNCTVSGVVTGTDIFGMANWMALGVGGVVGQNDNGTVENCSFAGAVSGVREVGGVVGHNACWDDSLVQDCHSSGTVYGEMNVGGVVGRNGNEDFTADGTVERCYSTSDVTGTGSRIGGVVGVNEYGMVKDCYSVGGVSGGSEVGGIVGWNYANVQNCFAAGAVSGDVRVGGVVGFFYDGTVEACIVLNERVTASDDAIGRVAGFYYDGSVTLAGNYAWRGTDVTTDTTWTPDTTATGKDGADLTADAVKAQGAWDTADFDFVNTWTWDDGVMPALLGEAFPWPSYLIDLERLTAADFSVSGTAYTYDGAAKSATVLYDGSVTEGEAGAITVSYSTASPTNAGVYDVLVTTAGGTTYAAVTNLKVGELTIGKASVTLTAGTPARTLIPFDGEDTDYGTTTVFDVMVTGLVGSDTVTVNIGGNYLVLSNNTVGATASEVTVTYNGGAYPTPANRALTIAANTNYVLSGTPTVTVTIADGLSTPIPVTEDNLTAFFAFFNGSTTLGYMRDYILMEDITLAGGAANWTVLGSCTSPFSGIFDGNGKTITNLTVNDSSSDYQGMFAAMDGPWGAVKNLTLENVSITGNSDVGAIVGYNNGGTVENCTVSGSVTGGDCYTGGMVGFSNNGTVSGCCSSADVTVDGNWVGGIVGYNQGSTIQNCAANGDVSGGNYVGGITGQNSSTGATVTNCYARGDAFGTDCVGGIAGLNGTGSTVTLCYATGSVSADDDDMISPSAAGGIVGSNAGTVEACIALNARVSTDDMDSVAPMLSVGRVVGRQDGSALNCYAWSAMPRYEYDNTLLNADPNQWYSDFVGADGEDLTADNAKTKVAWEAAGFDFTAVWAWDDSGVYMPSLHGEEIAWPV